MPDTKYYTTHELKVILEKESKKRELSPLAGAALEYLQKVSTLKEKDAVEMVKRFMDELKYDEKLAVKMVDILPQYPEEVRAVLQKIKGYDEKEIAKVIEIVKEFI